MNPRLSRGFHLRVAILDTKVFLDRVFAQSDEIVICVHKPDPNGKKPRGIFWNRGSFKDTAKATTYILKWDAEPESTVYYSVGAFANHITTDPTTGRRKYSRLQTQATLFKTLALDLDIGPGKPYATKREGWLVLRTALDAIGFPAPMVVSSGNGIHCYWPLLTPIPAAQWEKLSIALRLALQQHAVQIDTSKIHDTTMVLRPVGTHHKKQTPWKLVECLSDCPDYDVMALALRLKPWFASAIPQTQRARPNKPRSAVSAAILQSNDVVLDNVIAHCKQVAALVMTGGVSDAAGRDVEEPLWRASLGLAKFTTDPDDAVVRLAGQHPDFDLQNNLDKMHGWNAAGPTTCAEFERHCPQGCAGCPHQGKVKSPATLNFTNVVQVEIPSLTKTEIELPPTYTMRNGKIHKVIETEEVDGNGNAVKKTEYDLICDYQMHVTGIYNDPESRKSAFRLAIEYPYVGWVEEDHEMTVIASMGKDFVSFLLNRQVFVKNPGMQERLRGYLMDYLSMVQTQAPSGVDFIAFGWQKDGSFLCGERVINSPTGNTERRLRGAAARFSEIIKPHGSRDAWISAMQMLNHPGTQTIRSAILVATAGVLGAVAGNASLVMSIYSTETTTGKSLALIAANSLIGSPKALFMNKNDTANALFKVRGVLNNLPCTIDELTAASDHDAVNLAYDLSQGREKLAMDKNRDLREPVTWDGPTLITTNLSLHQKFEMVQANNDPLKARTMELHHHDRRFIETNAAGSSHGYTFFDLLAENNGWAMPELVELVVAMGGAKEVWRRGEVAFLKKFGFLFEPQERFYRTAIIGGWIMGSIGKTAGLFPFDVDATTQFLIDHVVNVRNEAVRDQQDVFDIIGQYLQENNDRLIEVTELYGSNKEQVRQPAPERAVARVKIVYDTNTPVLPGSTLSINLMLFKQWLAKSRDNIDRINKDLAFHGALIAAKERITMFKGCANRNPGQAHCLIVNLNHPRFVSALTGNSARSQSTITLAVLQGASNGP